MRPLKLTMSAFGPYSSVETIDFTKLESKNIFLITGPTGAGKTTIFDAISFALFGEASGSSRDKDSLRSDFASFEIPTYVELEFELRGQKYTVTRYPQQERKKAKGEGIVFKTSEASLKTPEGSIITKINAVDDKISNIIGINKNQFRQIVMLPQGEFRKLLEAESKEREIIFRKIFGTEAFQIIQQRLDNLQKDFYKRIKEDETKRGVHINNIETGEDETLIKLINAEYLNIVEIVDKTKELVEIDEEIDKKLIESINIVKQEQINLGKAINKGEELNNKLVEKKVAYDFYSLLKTEEDEYKEKSSRLSMARKALQVKLVEETLYDRRRNLSFKQKEHKSSENQLLEAEQRIIITQNKLKLEEGRQQEKIKLSEEITKLKDKEGKIKTYEDKSMSIIELKKFASEKEDFLEKLKLLLNSEKVNFANASENLMFIKTCEVEKAESLNLVEEKKAIIDKLRELRDKTNQYLNNFKEHEIEADSYKAFEKEFLYFKNIYETMQDNYLKAQAGILAKGLREGKECPVCGSTTHPRPAFLLSEAPTEEALNKSKDMYEAKQEEKHNRLRKLSSLNGKLEESLNELNQTKERLKTILGDEIINMSKEDIKKLINERGPKLKSELDKLENRVAELEAIISKKSEVQNKIKKLEEEIEKSEEQLSKSDEEYKQLYAKVISEEEVVKNLENEIPVETRTLLKLNETVNNLQFNLNNLEKAYSEAQEKYNEAKNFFSSCNAELQGKFKNVLQAEEEVKQWENEFNKKLTEYNFKSYEEYCSVRMAEIEIDLLDKEIINFHKKLQSASDNFNKYQTACEGLVEVDINILKEELEKFRIEEERLALNEKVVYSRINNNINVLEEIDKINSKISKDEEKFSVISDISKTANGFNEERITFERYVLAAYFDEIINAANLRLSKMTGGRFILKRKEEKGKGTKQEGLELEVFDNYTGKSRHVKTLSGGESFKASLALALGLADVVQAYAGGISLDTMFVDEGFGTLDPESLDNAIECLVDLQKGGRLVGIISHVPELKERIDVRLEITTAKEGSKASFVL